MDNRSKYISKDIIWCLIIALVTCLLLKNNFISNVGTAEDGTFSFSALQIVNNDYNLKLNIKSMSPLYQCWQILLFNFFEPKSIYFYNHIILIILTSIVCFYFFKSAYDSRIAAIATIIINSFSGLYNEDLLTYRFAFLILMLALHLFYRSRDIDDYVLSLLILYVSTYARSEFILIFLVIFLFFCHYCFISLKNNNNLISLYIYQNKFKKLKIFLLVLFVFTLSVNSNHEMSGSGSNEEIRVWKSFSQFYAMNIMDMGLDQVPGRDPSVQNQDIMNRDFPGASNIISCIIVSPTKIFRHIIHNIKKLSHLLFSYIEPFYLSNKFIFLLVIIILFAISLDTSSANDISHLNNKYKIIMLGLILSIIPSIIFMPKHSYIIQLSPIFSHAIIFLSKYFFGVFSKTNFKKPSLILFAIFLILSSFLLSHKSVQIDDRILLFNRYSIKIVALFISSISFCILFFVNFISTNDSWFRMKIQNIIELIDHIFNKIFLKKIVKKTTPIIIIFILLITSLPNKIFKNKEGLEIIDFIKTNIKTPYNLISLFPESYIVNLYPDEITSFNMINSNNDSKISNNKFEDTLDADKLVIIINRPWVFDSIVDSLKKNMIFKTINNGNFISKKFEDKYKTEVFIKL